MTRLETTEVATPLGPIRAAVGPRGVCVIGFGERWDRKLARLERHLGPLAVAEVDDPREVASRLRAYLAGHLDALDGIPVDPHGTSFQQRVWQALRTIPAGRTTTYGALAATIGQPTAVRAVGLANAHNPVGVVIPCHRVIGASGALTGYAGGLDRKRWLLEHEGALAREDQLALVGA